MCGRFDNHLSKMHGWADALRDWPKVRQSYNVAPTAQIAAFRTDSGEVMRWGMIPPWSKTFDSKYATFNARIESVEDKPTFRNAWKHSQRCLIPMAGYYEWTGSKGNKQPFYITDRDVGGLVCAGLYEEWNEGALSCTIITKPANEMLEHIHPRMPVLLTPESAHVWMNCDLDDTKDLLLRSELDSVIYYPVSTAVGNVRNDSKELIEPVDVQK